MSKRQLIEELHKPARKNFKRRRVIIKGLNDLFQADLVDMSAYADVNDGYHFLLTVIDTFSKFAFAIPCLDKSGSVVTKAMEKVIKTKDNSRGGFIPRNLQSDDGKEFFNANFKALMDKHKINHYSVYSSLKAGIIERFNRTLKQNMWKEFSMNGSYRWIDMIEELCNNYNNRVHRTIKMKPKDVNKNNEKKLLADVFGVDEPLYVKTKFHIGQSVRISKYKHVFEKSYTPQWTTEIFKILKIQPTNPETYLLIDSQNQPIKGGFYKFELQGVKDPTLQLVEKVIKRNKNKVYVKWLGFPESHNSWISKNEML